MPILDAVQSVLGELGVNGNVPVLDSPLSGRPATLPVGGKVEADEKKEVTGEDTTSGNGGKLFTSALAIVWHCRHVGRGEVGIGSEIDKAEVNHELRNLKSGDPLFPPDLDTTSRLEVVPVHDDVNREVKSDWNPGLGTLDMVVEMCRKVYLQLQCFPQAGYSTITQWHHGGTSGGKLVDMLGTLSNARIAENDTY